MSRPITASVSVEASTAPLAAFECSLVDGDPDAVCVRIAGELDVATAPEMELMLREARVMARLVVLDLRDVVFIDSSGMHAIVKASVQARAVARRLRGPANVDRMFRLTSAFRQLEFARADRLGAVCSETPRGRRSRLRRVAHPLREVSG